MTQSENADNPGNIDRQRRRWLGYGAAGLGLLAAGPILARPNQSGGRLAAGPAQPGPDRLHRLGPLGAPDENGIRLPEGFRSRVIARADHRPFPKAKMNWHRLPDGGACFPASDGGWIYVSNSEHLHGGASALRFSAGGQIVDAYPILRNTRLNCAGGATPWGTWLSCEEYDAGLVHECDPYGKTAAVARPAMGRFTHEACAVDPQQRQVYLTEDKPDGGFYRFTPELYPDLSAGLLEIAQVEFSGSDASGQVTWLPVPTGQDEDRIRKNPLRYLHPGTAVFAGAEGIWWHGGMAFFTTKWDNRVWAYDTGNAKLEVIYDAKRHPNPLLRGVDNITSNKAGQLVVAEDSDDMQLVVLDPDYNPVPLLQVMNQSYSELAGQFFSPDGSRLYFSSQRAQTRQGKYGITYEISGPFNAA